MSNSSNQQKDDKQGATSNDLKISRRITPVKPEPRERNVLPSHEGSTGGKEININDDIIVYIKDNQIDNKVLRIVCACLNLKTEMRRTLILKNMHYKTAKSSHLDIWYAKFEAKMSSIVVSNITDYIALDGHCNSEVLKLSVTPAPYLCTLNMYLYFPKVTSKYQETYAKAVNLLRQEAPPGRLPEILDRVYKLNHKVENLRNENVTIQFKAITGGNIPRTLANYCSEYISAFGNKEGGVIYFGIEDDNGIVFGVDLSKCSPNDIEEAVGRKIGGMFYGKSARKLKKGKHWEIQYFDIQEDQEDEKENTVMQSKKIIAVSVCIIPGGVFTAEPESYYADYNGNVHRYSFEDWRYKMITSYAESRGAVFIPDHRGDITQGSRGTEVIPDDIGDISQVHSNVYDYHVIHDYKYTTNYENLSEILKNNNCVNLKGYVGTGKSQLALRYGLDMKKENTLVWKFDCSNFKELWRSTDYLCRKLHCKRQDTGNREDDVLLMATTLNGFLKKKETSLHILIFDDVVKDTRCIVEKFVNVCLAKCCNLKVLVTSTLFVIEPELEIDGFSEAEAIHYIRAIEASDEERKQLVKTFSCNPLGLKIAIKYIKHFPISVRKFLDELSTSKGALEIEHSLPITQYRDLKPLFQSLHLILSDIHRHNPIILQKILLMQFLCSDKIPVILLENAHLSLFSGKIKEEGRCNSPSERIEDVICMLEQYSFASVRGKDDTMVIHTHSAILLAIEKYTIEAEESNVINISDMLKALLWAVVYLMQKDNRLPADLMRHTYLLPYAESILNRTRKLLENTDKAKTKQLMDDLSFSLPLVYVSDIVGYTYDFDEIHHNGEVYYKLAESYFKILVGMSVSIPVSSIEDVQIDAKETATQLYLKMISIIKPNKRMLDTLGKWYILNKYRSENELKIIQNALQKTGKSLNGKLRTEEDLNLLCENKLVVPKRMMGYFYFFEVNISFLYSYGKRHFYRMANTSESLERQCCYFLHVADHLSNIVNTINPNWKILYHLLTKRSGTIPQALNRNSNLPQPDLKHLKEIAEQCLCSLVETEKYFHFGTVCLGNKINEFNKVMWLKQLVKCYKIMLRVVTEEFQKEDMKQKGKEHVKHLEGLIQNFEYTSSLPGIVLCIGEFYECIRDFSRAKAAFKKLFHEHKQAEQKVKTRKNVRKAYICYFHSLLLELRDSSSEKIEIEACKEIEMLVPKCYKILMNYEELKELEDLLFSSNKESIRKHEERACYVYLENRLWHIQCGELAKDVYNQHLKEIDALLYQYKNMPLNHERSRLGNLESKLFDLKSKNRI